MKGALKPEAAAGLIHEGASLMIGGFMAVAVTPDAHPAETRVLG